MNLYFFMIHAFIPSVVSLRVPLYIQEPTQAGAQQQANALSAAFLHQFQVLFSPPDPSLLVPSVNGPTFDALIGELRLSPPVTLNLPINSGFTLYQHRPHTSPLVALEARSLIPGNHSMVYAL
ncbi:hypothetical protein [Rhodoferax sp.]|uniref:hypothetical protein n=1 Tax=Rhodoferax sp. TaxID=50421 RepID=UPI0028468E55|nr:hypothetical protein [Rhodoferax sp.]MDR3369512.1 hypothetical protein [Rhodoferax sp.]